MFVTLSEVEMRLYSLQMAFDSAQADTTSPFETASFFFNLFSMHVLWIGAFEKENTERHSKL
jgi:hypothetical protein